MEKKTLPLNSAIKTKRQLIQPCPRSWPTHPDGLIPKGMYQDAIHRREHKHVITHLHMCIELQRVTSPKMSAHVCDRRNSRPKWKLSCFFLLITSKERGGKMLKAINLAGCKTAAGLESVEQSGRNRAPKAATLTSGDGWVWSDVHALTLSFLGRLCYTVIRGYDSSFQKLFWYRRPIVISIMEWPWEPHNSSDPFLIHLIWEYRSKMSSRIG